MHAMKVRLITYILQNILEWCLKVTIWAVKGRSNLLLKHYGLLSITL